MAVHVDDLLAVGKSSQLSQFFERLATEVKLKRSFLGPEGTTFLGRRLWWDNRVLRYGICPRAYTQKLVDDLGWSSLRPSVTLSWKEVSADDEVAVEEVDPETQSLFRMAIGRLMWLTNSCPDLAWPTRRLAERAGCARRVDMSRLKSLLRYALGCGITGSQRVGVSVELSERVKRTGPTVVVASDSDYAGCESRKSTSGWAVWLVVGDQWALVDTVVRKQTLIALSVGEAETCAAVGAASDGMYYREALGFLGMECSLEHHLDSGSTISVMARMGSSRRTRHVEARVYWLQGLQGRTWFRAVKIATAINPADVLTKAMRPTAAAAAALGLA